MMSHEPPPHVSMSQRVRVSWHRADVGPAYDQHCTETLRLLVSSLKLDSTERFIQSTEPNITTVTLTISQSITIIDPD